MAEPLDFRFSLDKTEHPEIFRFTIQRPFLLSGFLRREDLESIQKWAGEIMNPESKRTAWFFPQVFLNPEDAIKWLPENREATWKEAVAKIEAEASQMEVQS